MPRHIFMYMIRHFCDGDIDFFVLWHGPLCFHAIYRDDIDRCEGSD